MSDLKITVIGAGSSYTPELIEKLNELKAELPVKKITLMDIDTERLEIMLGYCKRFAARLGYNVELDSTTNRQQAIEGAAFVITQLRVGGNAARAIDERIPLRYGLIGQETTGAGGFMKSLRTIPVLLDIAHDVEKYSPDAWIVNYTNPTGIVSEAVNKYSKAKIAGLCAGGLFPSQWVSKELGVANSHVKYDYFGLNHLNYAYNITIHGKPMTRDEFEKVANSYANLNQEIVKKLHLLPSPYLQYYYHTGEMMKYLKAAALTRGEEVQLLNKEIYEALADEKQTEKPAALAKRGGGGYSEVAVGLIKAIYKDEDRWMVVNVPNQGTVRFLPDDAVIETGCLVNSAGVKPLALKEIPPAVWGLVSVVKNYEQLTVEAAVSGSRDTSLLALLTHPLIRDYDLAKPLLDEMLEANKAYLPQFFW